MDKYEAIVKIIESSGIWAEVYRHGELPVICVEINHGDWKHDHGRADWLIEKAGFTKMSERVTYTDGSDNYSSVHYYA